jgi:hypothetical protein
MVDHTRETAMRTGAKPDYNRAIDDCFHEGRVCSGESPGCSGENAGYLRGKGIERPRAALAGGGTDGAVSGNAETSAHASGLGSSGISRSNWRCMRWPPMPRKWL